MGLDSKMLPKEWMKGLLLDYLCVSMIWESQEVLSPPRLQEVFPSCPMIS